jgi:hypothetical protein
MKHLKEILVSFIAIIAINSCATKQLSKQGISFYKHKNQDGFRNEFEVSSDRVTMICEQIMPDEDRYGFMIYILNNENRAVAFFQSGMYDLKWCQGQKSAVQKILDTGKIIYVGGMGKLDADEDDLKKNHIGFKDLGTFVSSNNSFMWMVIANENGKCFSQFRGSEPPCPGGEFPIENNPIK